MTRATLLAAALVCAAVFHAATAMAQQSPLLIEGRVANGTPGGGTVEGLIVTLHQHTVERDDDLTYPAGPDGSFRFENVLYDSETAYGVSVDYQGALYGVDLDLSAGAPEPINLIVYEGTDDESVISAPVVSLLIAGVDPDTQTILGMEISRITNEADLTYVPGSEPMKLLRFGLPQGHRDCRLTRTSSLLMLFRWTGGSGFRPAFHQESTRSCSLTASHIRTIA